jgi:hypothetical protein
MAGITIKYRGDKERMLDDHASLVAGLDSDGKPVALQTDSNGKLQTSSTVTSDLAGKATAAAPTYIEGSDNAFSLDLAGNLRIKLPATVRTPAIAIETGSTNSPITAGKKSVAFIFSSDFEGTVLTKAIDPTKVGTLGFEAPPGDTLAAIAFTVTNGSVTIVTLA